jgi:hypothetical protein
LTTALDGIQNAGEALSNNIDAGFLKEVGALPLQNFRAQFLSWERIVTTLSQESDQIMLGVENTRKSIDLELVTLYLPMAFVIVI